MPPGPIRFRLRGQLVDASLNRIEVNGRAVQVEPKIMQVLVALASRAGEVVTRDELMAAAWREVFVTDDVLHRAISELRRIFEDDPDRPEVIETIRKRGYRLVAPIEIAGAGTASAPLPSSAQALGRASPERARSIPRAFAIALLAVAVVLAGAAIVVRLDLVRSGTVTTEARVRFVPLTSEAGNEVDPALTADGTRLAYVAHGSDGRPHVFTKTIGGPAVQFSTGTASDFTPVWSPDGSALAYARVVRDTCSIQIGSIPAGPVRTVGPCGTPAETKMSWSPDGRSLAITAGDGAAETPLSPLRIELVDLATGYRRVLTNPPAGQLGDASPVFSPDGKRIAFVRTISGSVGDVFVADVADGAVDQVTTDAADIIGVDWEPDGAHLVFSSDRAGGYTLWRVAASGGAPTLVAGGGTKLKQPAVARRSGAIAYESWQYDINIVDMTATGSADAAQLTRLAPTTDQWNFHPQISPDGSRVAFQSTRSGQYELWATDRAGASPTQLTSSAVYKSMPRWSPDGRRLAFIARSSGRSEISVLDVDSRAARVVAQDEGAVAPSWTHDGRAIYFGSQRSGSWQIWKVDAASGHEEPVTSEGGYSALESMDGHSLYFTRLDRPGLWRRAIEGGTEELVTAAVQSEDWPSWGVIDRGVFFLQRPDAGDPVAMLLEPHSVAPRPLGRLAGYAWRGLSVSSDATHLLYPHTERRDANIMSIQLQDGRIAGSQD